MTRVEPLPIPGAEIHWVSQLPAALEGAKHLGPYAQARPGDALVSMPAVGRYRIRDGRRIEVVCEAGVSRERAAYFARVTPLGVLVHQRGELPLHASAVRHPDTGKTLLIAGVSGAGKSTTAAALRARGWVVLNDDLSRITSDAGESLVWPGFNTLKLWPRSCELLRLDTEGLGVTYDGQERYMVEGPNVPVPARAGAVVELDVTGSSADFERLTGADGVRLLIEHTFRRRFVGPLGCAATQLDAIRRIVESTPCWRLTKAHSLSPAEIAQRLEQIPL